MDGAQVKRTRTRLGTTVSTRHAPSTVWCAALLVLIVDMSLVEGRQEQAQFEDTRLKNEQHIVLESTSFDDHLENMAGAGLTSHVVEQVLRVVNTTPQAFHNIQTKRERERCLLIRDRNEYSR